MAARRATALAVALFVFGFGEELWFRYLPEYLRVLGVSAVRARALRNAARTSSTRPTRIRAGRSPTGSARAARCCSSGASRRRDSPCSVARGRRPPAVFVGLLLVMAWASLGLPATFSLVGEELEGRGRVVGFTVQSVLKRVPIVLAPPLGGCCSSGSASSPECAIGFAVSIVLSAPDARLSLARPAAGRRAAPARPAPRGRRPRAARRRRSASFSSPTA